MNDFDCLNLTCLCALPTSIVGTAIPTENTAVPSCSSPAPNHNFRERIIITELQRRCGALLTV